MGCTLSNIKLENNKKEHEEVKTLKINSSKAKLKLNWEPKYNLEKIVSEIVEWEKIIQSILDLAFQYYKLKNI